MFLNLIVFIAFGNYSGFGNNAYFDTYLLSMKLPSTLLLYLLSNIFYYNHKRQLVLRRPTRYDLASTPKKGMVDATLASTSLRHPEIE